MRKLVVIAASADRNSQPLAVSRYGSYLSDLIDTGERGDREVAMRTPAVIFVVALLIAGGAPALMNNACKTSHHTWCAPTVSAVPHGRTGHG